jgi:thiol-disulfide isomerase/thioredoxin
MKDLETDTLDQYIQEHGKVLVQYGAGWCGNCRMIKPKVKNLSTENDSIEFLYVDAEKLPGTRKLANVSNLPTFAAFSNGELLDQVQGNKIEIVQELVEKLKS